MLAFADVKTNLTTGPAPKVALALAIIWALGLQPLAVPMLGGAVWLLHLRTRKGQWRKARWWLFFLATTTVSVLMVDGGERLTAWGFRQAHYVAVGLVFVSYASSRNRMDASEFERICSFIMWTAVSFGWLSLAVGDLGFTSPLSAIYPEGLKSSFLIRDALSVELGTQNKFLSVSTVRAQAPFVYTNEWGAVIAVTFPIAMQRWISAGRSVPLALLVVAAPAVTSLNRGMWVLIPLGFAVLLAKYRGQAVLKVRFMALAGAAVVIAVLLASGLGAAFTERTSSEGHSDEFRSTLYRASVEEWQKSPIIGHGAPVKRPDLDRITGGISVGTHGHLWTLIVASGGLGLLFHLAFFGKLIRKAARTPGLPAAANFAALVVFIASHLIYGVTPYLLLVAMLIGVAVNKRWQAARLVRRKQWLSGEAEAEQAATMLTVPDRAWIEA